MFKKVMKAGLNELKSGSKAWTMGEKRLSFLSIYLCFKKSQTNSETHDIMKAKNIQVQKGYLLKSLYNIK